MSQLQVEHQHFVVGQAPDLAHARRVYRYLQHQGIDANDLRLAGPVVEQAEADSSDINSRDAVDGLALGAVGRTAEAGALIGALAGASIGAGGGLLVTAGHVGRDFPLFLAVVFVFTGLGAWVAASLSAARSMSYEDTWELNLDDAGDTPWIAVHVHNDREADRTRELLTWEGVALVEEHPAETLGIHTVRW